MLNIGKMIQEKRKQKGMTQEQLAQMVGVSAPAVSKWESGLSYPDITLLCPLARALDITVDYLLGYSPRLTEEQVLEINRACARAFESMPFEQALMRWQGYIREYPNSQYLKFRLGAMVTQYMTCVRTQEQLESFLDMGIRMLEDAAGMEQNRVSEASYQALGSLYLIKGEHDKALEALEQIPSAIENTKLMQACVYEAKGEHETAVRLNQECLFSAVTQVSLLLNTLAAGKEREGQHNSARIWAEKNIDFLNALEAPANLKAAPYFQLAHVAAQAGDRERTLHCLRSYVECLDEEEFSSALFSALDVMSPVMSRTYVKKTQSVLLEDTIFDFIRGEPAFSELFRALEQTV